MSGFDEVKISPSKPLRDWSCVGNVDATTAAEKPVPVLTESVTSIVVAVPSSLIRLLCEYGTVKLLIWVQLFGALPPVVSKSIPTNAVRSLSTTFTVKSSIGNVSG